MISAGDFRNGITIELEGNIYQIIEFQHVKPGKGAAFVRTKLKNIISGGVVEKTFRPTEKFDTAHIDRKDMQYLYSDGELYHPFPALFSFRTRSFWCLRWEGVGSGSRFSSARALVCAVSGSTRTRFHS